MTHPIHAINAETQRLWASQGIAPQLIVEAWTADDLGAVIAKSFYDSNDLHGPDWSDVARKVADAMGFALQPAPVGAGRSV